MDLNPLPEYTEELKTGLTQEKYFEVCKLAVQLLKWYFVSVSGDTIICNTQGGDNSLGEVVTIRVDPGKAVFHSRSANEYYWPDGQNRTNAVLFQKVISRILDNRQTIERKRNPLTREKYGALIPSKSYLITPLLIYGNILLFLIMVIWGISPISPDTQSLLTWGGNFRPLTISGQWWRLFTYMFLHGGIVHLLMNMFALVYIGQFLEPLLGKFRFAAAFLLTGICAGLLSITMHSDSVGVGASGAIFGLYGIFLAMLTTKHIEKTTRNTLLKSILFFVVFNLFYGLQGNIDNAAHIGGLISGIIIGFAFYPGLAKHQSIKKQAGITSVITIIIALLSLVILHLLPDDISVYSQQMKKFAENETIALEVYKMDKNVPRDSVLFRIKNKGINLWQQDIKILNEVKSLDLPPRIKERNIILLQYCRLRLEAYELFYRQVNEGNDTNNEKIQEVSSKISNILQELNSK